MDWLDVSGHCCFESRSCYDPRFNWPKGDMKARVRKSHELLESLGKLLLESLATALGLPSNSWEHLLDQDSEADLVNCSDSALRILCYCRSPPIGSDSYGGIHTDNSLL